MALKLAAAIIVPALLAALMGASDVLCYLVSQPLSLATASRV